MGPNENNGSTDRNVSSCYSVPDELKTFEDAPIHHHNFLKFIWMQIGPYQLMRKSKLIMKKMESGGYTDLKIDTEMIQREKPGKVELSRVQKREISHKRKKLNQVKFLQRYPSSQQPQ